jgi:hypothetical protein
MSTDTFYIKKLVEREQAMQSKSPEIWIAPCSQSRSSRFATTLLGAHVAG